MDVSRIDRINELYHKSQATGLTEEEKEEQAGGNPCRYFRKPGREKAQEALWQKEKDRSDYPNRRAGRADEQIRRGSRP